jgi:tight adherence protein B
VSLLAAVCTALAAGAAVLALSGFARRVAGTRMPDARGVAPRDSLERVGWRAKPSREQWLLQAGLDLTPAHFWLISGAMGVAAFTVLALATRAPLVALPPSIAAAALPHAYFAHRRRERLRAWQAAWPDALRELVAAIIAGRSLTQAIAALGESGPDPLREVFADFPTLARVFGTAAALEHIKGRLADPTSDRVIEVLLVAHERGGAIVRDVLEDLVVATTKDLKVLDEIDTDGLEMRINARAVLVLPWIVLVALTVRPGPFRDFYQTTPGLLVVGAAGALSMLGALWLGRLGGEPEEPRVFAGRAEPGWPRAQGEP